MSFRYDVLNLEILDDLRKIFEKPSTQWTESEYKKTILTIEAMRIVASQYKKE